MSYLPIENYGLIGNLHTIALIGSNGSVDWFCYPAFDSPSVFGAILDDARGGRFQITPCHEDSDVTCRQIYEPDTNILITRFLTHEGVSEITDFMPIGTGEENHYGPLIRQVKGVRGLMHLRMVCQPAFNYGRDKHHVRIDKNGASFEHRGLNCVLRTAFQGRRRRLKLKDAGDGGVTTEFTLKENECITFVFENARNRNGDWTYDACQALRRSTEYYWRNWLRQSKYRGRWREMVDRSALTLKLLTYAPTGAIVAAPTCSLPEGLGGSRNWDYRYTWIRDASFTVYGLMRLGFTDEAEKFMEWIKNRCGDLQPDGSLQIMYGLRGEKQLDEIILPGWEGYKQSAPVRVGNGAAGQLQLDIYGELMDSVYLYNKYGTPNDYDLWRNLSKLLEWVCDHWDEPDEGVWEVRGGRRHFLYSKLMCWVAVDRGLRLADKRSFPANRERWLHTRDTIYEKIMTEGYNTKVGAFVQSFGSETLDASNLLMPLVFFVSPSDPRMISTLEAIHRPPDKGGLVSDSLVYRYNVEQTADGLTGEEGTFSMCTFWLVEALTRAGQTGPARFVFEKMLSYANGLGLFAEEIGPRGEALGNYPQAFTHLGLISAAYNLDRRLG